jgi:hypothetical protein
MYKGPAKIVVVSKEGYERLVKLPNRIPSYVLECRSSDYMGETRWIEEDTEKISMPMARILKVLLKDKD